MISVYLIINIRDQDREPTRLSIGLPLNLPARSYLSANVSYGSGFLDGDGPDHLPGHTTVGLSFGKRLGRTGGVRCKV